MVRSDPVEVESRKLPQWRRLGSLALGLAAVRTPDPRRHEEVRIGDIAMAFLLEPFTGASAEGA